MLDCVQSVAWKSVSDVSFTKRFKLNIYKIYFVALVIIFYHQKVFLL